MYSSTSGLICRDLQSISIVISNRINNFCICSSLILGQKILYNTKQFNNVLSFYLIIPELVCHNINKSDEQDQVFLLQKCMQPEIVIYQNKIYAPTAIRLGCVHIMLQCPPCPDSIISSNINCGTYTKKALSLFVEGQEK